MQVTDCMAQGRLGARADSVQLYLWLMSQSYNPTQAYGQGPHCATGSHSGPRPLSLSTYHHSRKRRKRGGSGVGDFYGPAWQWRPLFPPHSLVWSLDMRLPLPGGEGFGKLVWLCAQQMGPASI